MRRCYYRGGSGRVVVIPADGAGLHCGVSPPSTLLQDDPTTPISPGTLALLSASAAGRHDQVFTIGLNWTNASVASFDVILDDSSASSRSVATSSS